MPRRNPQDGGSIVSDIPPPNGELMAPGFGPGRSRLRGIPTFTVTAFQQGSRDTTPKSQDFPFEGLVSWLEKPRRAKKSPPAWWTKKNPEASEEEREKIRKLSHPMFAGYRVRGGGKRRAADLEAFTLLVLDVDNKCDVGERLTLEDAKGALEGAGCQAILYTSWSHTPELPRFRVVLPLAGEVPAEAYRRWYPKALEALGWEGHPALDQVVDNPAQAYLVPLRRTGVPAPEVLTVPGEPLDVPVPAPTKRPVRTSQASPATDDARKIPTTILEEIRSRLDLPTLAERLGVRMKRQGRTWVACCPFPDHDEKTPSFKIQDGEAYFKCFGCNRGGDAFVLVRQLEGLDFIGAVKMLAHETGVVLPDRRPVRPISPKRRKKPGQGSVPEPRPADLQERARQLLEEHRLTEIGNGEWIATEHKDSLRYCQPMRSWLAWDGQRWAVDQASYAVRKAKDTILRMAAASEVLADVSSDESRIKKVRAWVERSQAARAVHNALEMAQTEPDIPIVSEDLDNDPWLLNVANGTLDLRTGQLRPHRRRDLLTKLVPIHYDPDANCPRWEAFVNWAMRDRPDLVDYLRRAVGYALTGSTREQCFFFLYGSGANGKSTLVGVLQELLGTDYGQTMRSDVLLPKRFDSMAATPEVARLKGVRFVSSVETEEERKLAEALIKQLTGGDKITARYLNQNPIEFWPTHKIFMAGNHKPEIRGTDHAIWRRVHLVPFDANLRDEDKDHDLLAKLKIELPGILAWAVRGCEEWLATGLAPPEEVRAATNSYRQEMDVLGDFLEEHCELHPKMSVGARQLYQAYRAWTTDVGRSPYSETKFGRRLVARGFQREHSRSGRRYIGIGLRSDR